MFEKHRQGAKQKAFTQHHRHTRKYDEGFEKCDNGFNSLGGPRYRNGPQSMGIVQEIVCPKKEDHPDPTHSLAKKDVLRQAYYKYAREDGHHPESYRVLKTLYERHIEGKHVPFQRYVIPPKNEKRLKTIKSYFLILELLYKMHKDQNVFLCLTM